MSEQETMPLDLNDMEDEELFDDAIFEKVSEKAGIDEAELAPAGQFLCKIKTVKGLSIIPYFNPPCPGVQLTMTVLHATKLYNNPEKPNKRTSVSIEEGKKYAGNLIYDKFGLKVPGENEKNKEKRAFMVKEFKLIKPNEPMKNSKFYELEGKLCLIDHSKGQKKDESGEWIDSGFMNIGMFGRFGYKYVDERSEEEREVEKAEKTAAEIDIDVDEI